MERLKRDYLFNAEVDMSVRITALIQLSAQEALETEDLLKTISESEGELKSNVIQTIAFQVHEKYGTEAYDTEFLSLLHSGEPALVRLSATMHASRPAANRQQFLELLEGQTDETAKEIRYLLFAQLLAEAKRAEQDPSPELISGFDAILAQEPPSLIQKAYSTYIDNGGDHVLKDWLLEEVSSKDLLGIYQKLGIDVFDI